MARALAAVGYTCLVCRVTGYNWHDLGFVPAPHADHDDFLTRCDPCGLTFTSPVFLEAHFEVHAHASPYFAASLNTPVTASDVQSLLPSGSTRSRNNQRSDVSSLPPGQRPPSYTSTQAPSEPLHLRQLLLDATSHLAWLAAASARQLSVQPDMTLEFFVRQVNLALSVPVSDVDTDFRHRLLRTTRLRLRMQLTCRCQT